MSSACIACGGKLHHSRLKTWYDRVRWRTTGLVPWRCQQCGRRSWHPDRVGQTSDEERELRPHLTDRELDALDPDEAQGERT